jgi:hypothetical protein
MGTNGANDYYQFFFGTNSYQVIRASSVPVLLVPQGCGYQDISTMVFAFDYEREQKLPMTQLTEWTSLLKAKITILQVKSHYTHEAEVNSKEIQARTKMYNNLADIEFDTIYSGEVINSINSYVLGNQADALALCSMNPSVIQTLFHQSLITFSNLAGFKIFIPSLTKSIMPSSLKSARVRLSDSVAVPTMLEISFRAMVITSFFVMGSSCSFNFSKVPAMRCRTDWYAKSTNLFSASTKLLESSLMNFRATSLLE